MYLFPLPFPDESLFFPGDRQDTLPLVTTHSNRPNFAIKTNALKISAELYMLQHVCENYNRHSAGSKLLQAKLSTLIIPKK
jgi:hypothetical protein